MRVLKRTVFLLNRRNVRERAEECPPPRNLRLCTPKTAIAEGIGDIFGGHPVAVMEAAMLLRNVTNSDCGLSRFHAVARCGNSAEPPPSGDPLKSRRITVSKTE